MSIFHNKEVKNACWLIGGKVMQMILSLIVSVLMARYLGPSNYGLIGYAGAFVAFFTSFCTLGINSIIIRDFVDHPEEQGEAIGSTLVLRAVSSILSSIVICIIVFIIDKNEPTTKIVVALSCISLIFQIFDTFNFWFQSRYQSKVTSIASFLAYFIVSIYKIILLILGKSVEWFAFASSLDFICIGIFLYSVYRKYNGPKLSFSWQKAKSLLNNSYHYILSGMMVAIYGHTDKLMLKQMVDASEVGYYSIATSVSMMWVFVLAAIIDSMYPTIMNLYDKNRSDFNRKNIQLYAIVIYISFFVSIVFMILGKPIISMLYGEQYLGSVGVLKVVTWYTAFSYLGVARNAWIVCEHKQKYLKYIYFAAAVLNIILNLLFIPCWRAVGAAYASLITQICTSIIFPSFLSGLKENTRLMLDAFVLKDVFFKKYSDYEEKK